MHHHTDRLLISDGVNRFAKAWTGVGRLQGMILFVHGLGEHRLQHPDEITFGGTGAALQIKNGVPLPYLAHDQTVIVTYETDPYDDLYPELHTKLGMEILCGDFERWLNTRRPQAG